MLLPRFAIGAEIAAERLFSPHGQRDGAAIGANADTDRYRPG
jgi:hypothetical protein